VLRGLALVAGVAAAAGAAALAAPSGHAGGGRAADDLTPAQQCVADHFGPNDPAATRGSRTVGGWAFLDGENLIAGARIHLIGPAGRRSRS